MDGVALSITRVVWLDGWIDGYFAESFLNSIVNRWMFGFFSEEGFFFFHQRRVYFILLNERLFVNCLLSFLFELSAEVDGPWMVLKAL